LFFIKNTLPFGFRAPKINDRLNSAVFGRISRNANTQKNPWHGLRNARNNAKFSAIAFTNAGIQGILLKSRKICKKR